MERAVGALDAAALLEQLADAVVVADAGGVIQYVNSATARLLGWRSDELAGQPLTVLIPERLHAAHWRSFRRYVETRRPRLVGGPAVQVPARHRDGSEVQVELTIGVPETPYGDEPTFVATLRDVSERVELERRLALTDFLQATLDVAAALAAAPSSTEGLREVLPALMRRLDWEVAGLWLVDEAEERLRNADMWNAGGEATEPFVTASRALTFVRGEGLPGRCWRDEAPVIAPDVSAVLVPRAALARDLGLRAGVAFPLIGAQRVLGVVELFTRNDPALDNELPVVLAGVGRQIGQFLERVRAEDQIRRSEARYRSLVAATALDVWRASASGELLEDMPHWREMTGQTPEELLGDGWLDAVVPEDRERVEAAWSAATARGEVYETEYRVRVHDGTERVISARGVPVSADGTSEYVGVCTDVTEERRGALARAALADALQRALLPPHLPQPPGLAIASAYRAGGGGLDIGGDFYDVFPVESGTWDLAIGDVRGKGPEAAAVTGLAQYTIRAVAIENGSPARVLHVLNEVLLRHGDPQFFLTAVHARIRPGPTGAYVVLSSAGHPLPLLVSRDGSVRPVGRGGMLAGAFPEFEAHDTRVWLERGQTLVFVTDGVLEPRRGGEQFGDERLAEVLLKYARRPVEEMVEAIERAVVDFGGTGAPDDLAILAVRATGAAADFPGSGVTAALT